MKSLMIMAILSALAVASAFSQENAMPTDNIQGKALSTEITGTLQYIMPDDDDTYDSGFGAEGQIRFWENANVGFALAGGIASWDINEQEIVESDGFTAIGASIEGSILMVPIGGSILVRSMLADNLSLTLEGGLRYVIVESDAQMEFAVANARGVFVGGSADIEIDNGIIGLVAANIEAELSPGVSLLCGFGYQFDIAKGDAKWMGEDLEENELKAFFLRAGIALVF